MKFSFLFFFTAIASIAYARSTLIDSVYSTFDNWQIDKALVTDVNDFDISRDVAGFHLKKGRIAMLKPVNGREIGFIFVGEGNFTFNPMDPIEQDHLFRNFERKNLKSDFDFLLFIADDNLISELRLQLPFKPMDDFPSYQRNLANALDYILHEDGGYVHTPLLRRVLNPARNGYLYVHINRTHDDPLMFEINPSADEEIRLYRRAKTAPVFDIREIISLFPSQETYYSRRAIEPGAKDEIIIDSYELECSITSSPDFSARAKITFTVNSPRGVRWIPFFLYRDLLVDSVQWLDGTNVNAFTKHEENPVLWIDCGRNLKKGEQQALQVWYDGEVLDYIGGRILIKNSTGWYPIYNRKKKTIFEMTFHTPESMRFVAVGEKLSENIDEDVRTTHWFTRIPIRNASFNLGYFEEYTVEEQGISPVHIWMNREGMTEMAQYLVSQGNSAAAGAEEDVGADVANALAFFEQKFGKLFPGSLYITGAPRTHSEAFPGLIHLSFLDFVFVDEYGNNQVHRAHEVAHQWWGVSVDYKTYHDQWLSEGLASYAGLWYLQASSENSDKFFSILSQWRDLIFENRQYLLGSGQKAGPIILGFRNRTSTTKDDYNVIVYRKAAWVIHMLRHMMMNMKDFSQTDFENGLKEFFATYREKAASTENFRTVMERHCGCDLGWFFNQWVYGTALPTYHFSYSIEEMPKGKYRVQCRVKQEGVPPGFKMPVPILVQFDDDRFAIIKVLIDKPQQTFYLPVLPMEPEKIKFNALESVLCRVVGESS